MNNTIIAETTSHKHLGLTFSSTCTWPEHMSNISVKTWIRLNLLRVPIKFRVSRKSLENVCSAIESAIPTETARIVSGATKFCSIEKLFVELGWESHKSHRIKHKLVIFFKILHGLAPGYLSDLLPPLVQQFTSYNLLNSDNIQSYRAQSNLFQNSLFPSTISAWNELQSDTKMHLPWPHSKIDSTKT